MRGNSARCTLLVAGPAKQLNPKPPVQLPDALLGEQLDVAQNLGVSVATLYRWLPASGSAQASSSRYAN